MSQQNSTNNQSDSVSIDGLLESIVNLYTEEQTQRQPQQNNNQTRNSRYPLSFNIQRPRQSPIGSSSIPTANSTSTQSNTNQQFSGYLSVIQTLRDIGNQYNNNMREYNTNMRIILNTINEIREDLQLRNNTNNVQQQQHSPRRPHNSIYHDGLFSQTTPSLFQTPFTSRPNQNRSYVNQPSRNNSNNTNNNLFDVLFQTISLPQNMENVVVRPSEEQIRNATRAIIYSPNNANITNNSCPITLEPFEEQQMLTQIIYCGHVFSQDGINRWFENNVRCPICRYDIRNYNKTISKL